MSRGNPRRPASSRAPTSRPRKIAGRTPGTPEPEQPAVEEPAVEEPAVEEPAVEEAPAEEPEPDRLEQPAPRDGAAEPAPGSAVRGEVPGPALASPRTTRMLLGLAAVLVVLLAVQGLWWLRHEYLRDEPAPPRSDEAAISVPSGRPVVASELVVQEGVQAAAEAVQKIVGRTHQGYDEEVAAATELMTDEFAEQYRETTDAVKEDFIEKSTTVQVRVMAQGVVRANDAELQALLFLNQYVTREGGKNPKTIETPYRALVTMVNTDQGWLVDDIDTK